MFQVMIEDEAYAVDALLDLAPPVPNKNDLDGNNSSGGGGGGGGFAAPPMPHQSQQQAFAYPPPVQQPPGYPQAPNPYPYPQGGATAYPPPPMNSVPHTQNLSEKDILSMNEGPPPYFPSDPSASAPPPRTSEEPSNNQSNDPSRSVPAASGVNSNLDLPELPTVPNDTPTHARTPDNDAGDDEIKKNDEEDIDFDDLTRRFEALKKKK